VNFQSNICTDTSVFKRTSLATGDRLQIFVSLQCVHPRNNPQGVTTCGADDLQQTTGEHDNITMSCIYFIVPVPCSRADDIIYRVTRCEWKRKKALCVSLQFKSVLADCYNANGTLPAARMQSAPYWPPKTVKNHDKIRHQRPHTIWHHT
jgi:hypothetical protein